MPRTRSVEKEIEALKRDIRALKNDYAALKDMSSEAASEHFGSIKDEVAATLDGIKAKISDSTGNVAGEIGEQIEDLKAIFDDYTAETEKKITAHPLAAVAGAIAIGFLIGRVEPMSPDAAIDAVTRHLRLLWRAESLVAEIRLRSLARRSIAAAVAALICVFGLVMLNIAAYAWLTPIWGAPLAALAVALGDFVIAGVLVLIASRGGEDPQLALATEMRDQAVEAIETDMKLAAGGLGSLARNPVSLVGPAGILLIRLIRTILNSQGNKKPS